MNPKDLPTKIELPFPDTNGTWIFEIEAMGGKPATFDSPPEPATWTLLSIKKHFFHRLEEYASLEEADLDRDWFEKWVEEQLAWREKEAQERFDYIYEYLGSGD